MKRLPVPVAAYEVEFMDGLVEIVVGHINVENGVVVFNDPTSRPFQTTAFPLANIRKWTSKDD